MDTPVVHTREEIEDTLNHFIPSEPLPKHIDDAVFLEIQTCLSSHPDTFVQRWRENPRLYTLLRLLGYDTDSEVFRRFDSENIGDVWLPLSPSHLSDFSHLGVAPDKFRRMQFHILSKPERTEKQLLSTVHQHLHIFSGKSHYNELEVLGEGGSAKVSRVQHKLSEKEFARKCIVRDRTLKGQQRQLVEFEQEVSVLKRVSHKHLVSFVASYTDPESFCLILNPVAKDVLTSVLERQKRDRPLPREDIAILRRSFGCLATALTYLDEHNVRHKDIKPGNILLSDGIVYLCDFGIARDWSNSGHSTTTGDVIKYTPRYCAPEVWMLEARNQASDIWSLGCVFLELVTVIRGYPLDEMNSFLKQNSVDGPWSSPEAVSLWLDKMKGESAHSDDDLPFDWIRRMIKVGAKERPTAAEIVSMIQIDSVDLPRPNHFIGSCCCRIDSVLPPSNDIPDIGSPTISFKEIGLGINQLQRRAGGSSSNAPSRGTSRDPSVSPRGSKRYDRTGSGSASLSYVFSPQSAQRPVSVVSDNSSRTSESRIAAFTPVSPVSSFQPSPIPPAAEFELNCNCGSGPFETHIFNAPFSSLSTDMDAPSVHTCSDCGMLENRVQVYESRAQEPNAGSRPMAFEDSARFEIEWVTRRLVVSHMWGSPQSRVCSSFWLPLADLSFSATGSEVTLRWSDCNQMTGKKSANYGRYYDWDYNPNNPNNSLTLRFDDNIETQRFLDCVRFPTQDGVSVRNARTVEASEVQEARIYDICRGPRNALQLDYRVVVATNKNHEISTSKLFMVWPHLDLDIQILGRFDSSAYAREIYMTANISNITTPSYNSDTNGQPAVDHAIVAKYKYAYQKKSSLAVTFPLGPRHSLPIPPSGVGELLHSLTGWDMRYFAILDKFKSPNRRIGSKRYNRSDIILWIRNISDSTGRRRVAQITIRTHEDTVDGRWVSGTISNETSITYSASTDATITVANKARGQLLDVTRMTAISTENASPASAHHRSASDASRAKDLSELVLSFEDNKYRLKFVETIEQLKDLVGSLGMHRASAASGYGYEARRMNSLR